jgi:hypothetical protein
MMESGPHPFKDEPRGWMVCFSRQVTPVGSTVHESMLKQSMMTASVIPTIAICNADFCGKAVPPMTNVDMAINARLPFTGYISEIKKQKPNYCFGKTKPFTVTLWNSYSSGKETTKQGSGLSVLAALILSKKLRFQYPGSIIQFDSHAIA